MSEYLTAKSGSLRSSERLKRILHKHYILYKHIPKISYQEDNNELGNTQFYLMLIALIIANLIDSLFFKIIGLYTVIFLFMKGNARFQSKNKKEKKTIVFIFFYNHSLF